jgi:hypothetical protein
MDFFVRVMRYLFWLFVLSWSMWLLKKGLGWMLRKATGPGAQTARGFGFGDSGVGGSSRSTGTSGATAEDGLSPRKLVRDPVCGVYLAEVLAIPLRTEGELLHFCSTSCRDKHATQIQRRAAAV